MISTNINFITDSYNIIILFIYFINNIIFILILFLS